MRFTIFQIMDWNFGLNINHHGDSWPDKYGEVLNSFNRGVKSQDPPFIDSASADFNLTIPPSF